ncbi:Y-family DNA polymerase [Alteromonas flava]|uniref:Y-family DNA polymerase n=1 Tax=Alteromonas flava TaxID=2048003 RepID=UPI000C292F16|nr:DNA polymerase Y family protein [Alteromonas flava]
MQGLWLYVHFNALQLSSVVDHSGLSALDALQPIAIYDAQNNQLCQLNKAAQQQGLSHGQGLASASALCSELTIIEYDNKCESQRLSQIAEQLYGITADIALDPPDGLFLRADNMLKLYASLSSYWQTLQSLLCNYTYNYASACSMSAAKVLARAQYNRISDAPREWKQALRRCSLRHSSLTDKQLQTLKRVGITSFDDLFKQPVSALAARFDGFLLRYLSELKGERFERLPLFRPARRFHQHSEFLYEITLSERLLKPLEYLLVSLERYLIQRALVTFDLNITLILRDKQKQQWRLHSAQGENRSKAWLSIARVAVERLELTAPVQAMSLSANELTPILAANDDLFTTRQSELTPLQLITRLQARLGERCVYQLGLGNDHRPEYASQRLYLTDQQPAKPTSVAQPLHDRPSLLLPAPQPLAGKSRILTAPERLCTGWWSAQPLERDYFIAQNELGQYLWVFRDQHKRWFVHGYFV